MLQDLRPDFDFLRGVDCADTRRRDVDIFKSVAVPSLFDDQVLECTCLDHVPLLVDHSLGVGRLVVTLSWDCIILESILR